MSNVKNQILEQLVRKCICEVLDTMNIKEVGKFQLHPRQEESIGAPAPPAEGQGTADQPPIPKEINELKKVIKKMVRKTLSK
jgi:hypothetical protein